MNERDRADETPWAMWLREALRRKGFRPFHLAKASEGAIKPDRVSKWLNKGEAPTYRNAQIVANILEVPQEEALQAAGYAYIGDATDAEGDTWTPKPQRTAVSKQQTSASLSDYSTLDLLAEVQRRLGEQGGHSAPPPQPTPPTP